MGTQQKRFSVFSLLFLTLAYTFAINANAATAAPMKDIMAISASTIEAMNADLSTVSPAVRTPMNPEFYLSPVSALGQAGPISAYGPLGALGPLGSNAWNVTSVMNLVGDWFPFSNFLTSVGGPLSANGPLGPLGPLNARAYYADLPSINDFSKQLQIGGVWGVLGPLGPLGALGPLGPLGPNGAHGLKRDADGNYVHNGQIYRQINVNTKIGNQTTMKTRPFELYEMYTETAARRMTDNDTSFMVEGEITSDEKTDTYSFTSNQDQFVTILVVPEKALDNFKLVVHSPNLRVAAASTSDVYINWITLRVPAGTKLTANVVLAGSGHLLSKTYRLYVVGSTDAFNTTDIEGSHQAFVTPLSGRAVANF